MDPLLYFLGIAILVGTGSYFLIQYLDTKRMRDYFLGRGEVLVSSDWQLFGPGWVGERDSRIYSIRYKDRQEKLHMAFAKTSLFSGVFITDDRVMEFADSAETRAKLRAKFKEQERILPNPERTEQDGSSNGG